MKIKYFELNLRKNHSDPEDNMKKLLKSWIKVEEKHKKIFKFMSNLPKCIKTDVSGSNMLRFEATLFEDIRV